MMFFKIALELVPSRMQPSGSWHGLVMERQRGKGVLPRARDPCCLAFAW